MTLESLDLFSEIPSITEEIRLFSTSIQILDCRINSLSQRYPELVKLGGTESESLASSQLSQALWNISRLFEHMCRSCILHTLWHLSLFLESVDFRTNLVVEHSNKTTSLRDIFHFPRMEIQIFEIHRLRNGQFGILFRSRVFHFSDNKRRRKIWQQMRDRWLRDNHYKQKIEIKARRRSLGNTRIPKIFL